MKIRHIGGTKVCAVEDTLNEVVTVYNYKDIVGILNRMFREAEISEYTGPEQDPMRVALMMIAGSSNVKVQKYKLGDVVYDDEILPKKSSKPTFKLPRFTNSKGMYRGLKVIEGGKLERS